MTVCLVQMNVCPFGPSLSLKIFASHVNLLLFAFICLYLTGKHFLKLILAQTVGVGENHRHGCVGTESFFISHIPSIDCAICISQQDLFGKLMSENKIHLSVYLSYALWRMYGNEKIKMRAIHLEFII